MSKQLSEDEFFMALAFLASGRSKDVSTQVIIIIIIRYNIIATYASQKILQSTCNYINNIYDILYRLEHALLWKNL